MRLLLVLVLAAIGFGQDFTVRETAGLRRFGYPVRATINRGDAGSLLLLEEGKPVPAQFTARGPNTTEIDFAVSLGPNERRHYRVKTGVPAAPSAGIECEETADSMVARQPGGPEYVIPKNLVGLLSRAGPPEMPHLRPGSFGLAMIYRDGSTHKITADPGAEIFKKGPFACGFRFTSRGLASTVNWKSHGPNLGLRFAGTPKIHGTALPLCSLTST